MPIRALLTSSIVSKDKEHINKLKVKPMPLRILIAIKVLQLVLLGKVVNFNFIKGTDISFSGL